MFNPKPSPLRSLQVDEFLPPVSRWIIVGGGLLIGAVGLAVGLASIVTYNVAVRAPATVRPAGELRVVQSALTGTVASIDIQPNQTVQQGDVIARLDPTQLNSQQQQLQGGVQQLQIQRAQVETQIQLMRAQMASESRAIAQTVATAQSELDRNQRELSEQQATTEADLAEAQAALDLATVEVQRYQQLVDSGAVSQLQLDEKRAAVQTAMAQVRRARAALNPIDAGVAIAQQQILHEESRGRATLATLQREQELLLQNQAELQAQLLQAQQDLQQVDADLVKTIIRAATEGTVFQLNLRNPNQVVQAGDVVAQIAPNTQNLVIKARVDTQDIDRVQVGQLSQLRIEACPFPDYGTLAATVSAIAPDVSRSEVGGDRPESLASYFEVTLQPDAITLIQTTPRNRRPCQLQAGMQAEANIISREETFLQFLLRQTRLLTGG